MATLVLTDAFVSWGGVDLSDHVRTVTLTASVDLKDATAMGNAAQARKAGLQDWSADIEFFADEAAANVCATLMGDLGTEKTLIVRPVKSTVVGATNPNYTGAGLIESVPIAQGTVGEMQMTPVTIRCSDGNALSRATS